MNNSFGYMQTYFDYNIGPMRRQSLGFSSKSFNTGRKNAFVRWWSCGQYFCHGSAWICDRSEKWIQELTQRHKRSAAITAWDDCLSTISTANYATNIQIVKETNWAKDWAPTNVHVIFSVSTASLNVFNEIDFNYFIERTSPSQKMHLNKGRIMKMHSHRCYMLLI